MSLSITFLSLSQPQCYPLVTLERDRKLRTLGQLLNLCGRLFLHFRLVNSYVIGLLAYVR